MQKDHKLLERQNYAETSSQHTTKQLKSVHNNTNELDQNPYLNDDTIQLKKKTSSQIPPVSLHNNSKLSYLT